MPDSDRSIRQHPDESPPNGATRPSAELIAALAALQHEFQQYLARTETPDAAQDGRADEATR